MCKTRAVLNARVGSDANVGMCTGNGHSAVDYITGSSHLFSQVIFFFFFFAALSSDVHCPLHLTLNIKPDECVVFTNQYTPEEFEQEDSNYSTKQCVE